MNLGRRWSTATSSGWEWCRLIVSSIAGRPQVGEHPALLEPVALSIHLQVVNAVRGVVQQSTGQPLRAEDLGPLVRRQTGGDQDRASFVALSQDLKGSSAPILESGT